MVIRADKRPWDMPEDANRVGRTHRLGHNPTPDQAPILCHLEVVREEAPPRTAAQ